MYGDVMIQSNLKSMEQSDQVIPGRIIRRLRAAPYNRNTIVRFGNEKTKCTNLSSLVEARMEEEELPISGSEIVQEKSLPVKVQMAVGEFLNMIECSAR